MSANMKTLSSGLQELNESTTSTRAKDQENSIVLVKSKKLEQYQTTTSRGAKMQGKVINKLALLLLSIVVLELILIGDQVQPVKGIKKKIYLKKLKKLLPLLALVKPKKKIILVPVS